MEIIGTQFKPTVALDPLGSAKAGMELGVLGLQPMRIAQELRTAQIEERQKLIAEQEAQRALDLKRREDASRASLARYLRDPANQIKDEKTGKVTLNYTRAFEQALQDDTLDPKELFALQEKAYENRSKDIKNASEVMAEIEKRKIEWARVIRNMPDDQGARYLQAQVDLLAKQFNLPAESLQMATADFFGVRPGISLRESAKARIEAIDISEQQAIQNKFTQTQLAQAAEQIKQAGLQNLTGPDARKIDSAVTKAAQAAAITALGPNATEDDKAKIKAMTAAEIANLPGLRELLQADVKPADVKAGFQAGAIDDATQADFFGKLVTSATEVSRLRDKYNIVELTPANIIANKVNQALLDVPEIRNFVSLVQEMNAKGIPIPENAGPTAVAKIAREQQSLKTASAKRKDAAGAAGRTSATPPATGVVLRNKQTGALSRPMPEDVARRALASGQFERVQ